MLTVLVGCVISSVKGLGFLFYSFRKAFSLNLLYVTEFSIC